MTLPDMNALLGAQRSAFVAARPEDLSVRADRLDRMRAILKDEGEALARAMSRDFGHRSFDQSMLTDIMPAMSAIRYAKANLKRFARPERRRATFPLGLIGGRAEVRYEPKGVVGIVSPWNFPVVLAIAPIAQAIAAGNRVMLKPSEFTPETSALLCDAIARRFAPEELAAVLGGADTGQAFCGLPFDHLLFTGATAIGRHVARAAAENLVPLTLELGGKSPTILGRSADLPRSAERIAIGKTMNAGQVCLAPDYLIVPRERRDDVVRSVANAAARLYPAMLANDDYTSIVNARHRDRLRGLIDDAVGKGATATTVNPANEDFAASNGHKLPLTILTDVDDTMAVMQEEIFGPVLPVMTYERIDDAIDYVNAHDRPLGLYYFGEEAEERETVLGRTLSGGVTVNDVIMHIAMEDLPFGGVGPSGMGAYHGIEGFRTFSHARAVYQQPRFDIAALAGLKPPYGRATRATLRRGLK